MRKWFLVMLVFVLAFPAGAFAGAYITGAEIVDGSVRTVDLGKGAVKAGKIYKSAITTAKIRPGAVTPVKTTGLAPSSHNHDTDYYTVDEMNDVLDAFLAYMLAIDDYCTNYCGSSSLSLSDDHMKHRQELKEIKAKIEALKK